MPNVIRVAVVNHSTLEEANVESGVAALQEQVKGDLAAAWGIDAELFVWGTGGVDSTGAWGLILLDRAPESAPAAGNEDPQAGSFRELTSRGLPETTVVVGDVVAGQDWTHRASHQLLEMLVSPIIAAPVFGQVESDGPPARLALYAREVCDPCAGYEYSYECRGRRVSDFVFPSWFGLAGAGAGDGGHLDERRRIQRPFQVLSGGWAHLFALASGEWLALDENGRPVQGAPVDSRLERLQRAMAGLDLERRRNDGVLYPP
jgi:hypothetical protein